MGGAGISSRHIYPSVTLETMYIFYKYTECSKVIKAKEENQTENGEGKCQMGEGSNLGEEGHQGSLGRHLWVARQ